MIPRLLGGAEQKSRAQKIKNTSGIGADALKVLLKMRSNFSINVHHFGNRGGQKEKHKLTELIKGKTVCLRLIDLGKFKQTISLVYLKKL